ncbi:MAG: hypothetical protein V9H26_08520 [Verrucomicrobiota bacterium]
MNYATKSSYLLSFLESVPEVAAKLKKASGEEKKFEDVVKEAEQAAVLVLVYRGGARLLTSRLARTLAPPVSATVLMKLCAMRFTARHRTWQRCSRGARRP